MNALQRLDLSRNQSLGRMTFAADCPALEELDLSNNTLEHLEMPTGFRSLRFLYLHDNRLRQFQPHGRLRALETLHLRNNALEVVGPDFLQPFPVLESLYLYGNPLDDALYSEIENSEYGNCLPFVRQWIADLRQGIRPNNECKVLYAGQWQSGQELPGAPPGERRVPGRLGFHARHYPQTHYARRLPP